MLAVGDSRYKNSFYYLCNSSVCQKSFFNKKFKIYLYFTQGILTYIAR